MNATGTLETRAMRPLASPADAPVKPLNLVLQGGVPGAFTWGVLERLLEDERVAIETLFATSSGALNAVALAYGHAIGGRDGARQAMAGLWRRIAHMASASQLQATWLAHVIGNPSNETSPSHHWMELMTRVLSPYQLNPFNYNPLRDALEQTIEFEALRRHAPGIRLFLGATHVRTGRPRVFGNAEVSIDAVLAATCSPFLNQAVEIEGERYWDGGYSGSTAILALNERGGSRDIVLVHNDTDATSGVPMTAGEIMNRIGAISVNAVGMHERRAIVSAARLAGSGDALGRAGEQVRVHAIGVAEPTNMPGASVRSSADWEFLLELRDSGREQARAWLGAHVADLGQRSSAEFSAAVI